MGGTFATIRPILDVHRTVISPCVPVRELKSRLRHATLPWTDRYTGDPAANLWRIKLLEPELVKGIFADQHLLRRCSRAAWLFEFNTTTRCSVAREDPRQPLARVSLRSQRTQFDGTGYP